MKKLTITYIMLLSLTTALYSQEDQQKSLTQRLYDKYTSWRFNQCEQLRSEFIQALAKDQQQNTKVKLFFPKCMKNDQHHARNIFPEGTEYYSLHKPPFTNLLCLAALHNSTDSIECLLQGGMDINQPEDDFSKKTPLHIATAQNQIDSVQYLLEHGAHINAQTTAGNTPLDVAVLLHRTKIANLLQSHGGKKINTTNVIHFNIIIKDNH